MYRENLDFFTGTATPATAGVSSSAQTSLSTQHKYHERFYPLIGKRILDLCLLVTLMPVALLLIAVFWAILKWQGGTGFFVHERLGQHGRKFGCIKLRTMCPDATTVLKAHLAANPDAAREWATCQKLDDDPRVTRLGRFLRRSSIDELPQVWNVLKGEMSFIGPRPVTAEELPRYGAYHLPVLSMKPGISGLWQVSDRLDGTYPERLRLDVAYRRLVSLRTDLAIIFATIGAVMRMTGR